MPSFGEKLKQEREKRKITLEQISLSTKIGIRMLQALEEDKFNQLPGGIFNKGFVRAYCRSVGLDEGQTVADYLEASGEVFPASGEPVSPEEDARRDSARRDKDRDKAEAEENLRRLDSISDGRSRPLPWGAFAAGLLVVAFALSLWNYRHRDHTRQAMRPAPAATGATTPAPAAQSSGEVPGGESGENSGAGSPNSGSPGSGPLNSGAPATSSTAGKSGPFAVPATPQGLAPAAPAATPGEFTVVIQAREESWISITADGRTIARETLEAGSERTIRGRKEIVVKAGNAGGLDFRFNGRKLETGGEFGEVKTITFGPQGILPNAPAPAPAPIP